MGNPHSYPHMYIEAIKHYTLHPWAKYFRHTLTTDACRVRERFKREKGDAWWFSCCLNEVDVLSCARGHVCNTSQSIKTLIVERHLPVPSSSVLFNWHNIPSPECTRHLKKNIECFYAETFSDININQEKCERAGSRWKKRHKIEPLSVPFKS